MTNTPALRPHYRPDVDGLRAVAIIAVVAYHAGVPGFGGGYVGVDVFFVISGFLITQLLVTEVTTVGTVHLLEFYARRARRLVPAMTVVLLSVLVLGRLFLNVLGDQQALAWSVVTTVLFSSNIFFLETTGGYFAPTAETQPLLHTWSLGVEEQYYLAWPLMVFMVAMASRGTGLNLFRKRLAITFAVLFAASLALCVWSTANKPAAAYYLMPMRAWEFAVGGLFALAVPWLSSVPTVVASALGMVGLICVGCAVALMGDETPFPGVAALLPTVGTALAIAGGVAGRKTLATRLLASRPMVWIGLVSYSWYLWHWPMLVIPRLNALREHQLGADVGLALLSLFFAALTYLWVEKPFRRSGPRTAHRPLRTLAAAGAVSATMIVLALLLGWSARNASQAPRFRALLEAKGDRPPLQSKCNLIRENISLPAPQACIRGAVGGTQRIVLWGDSHADHMMPLATAEATELGAEVLQRSHDSCPPLIGVIPLRRASSRGNGPRESVACGAFNHAVFAELTHSDTSRTVGVVLSARWPGYIGIASPFKATRRDDLIGVGGQNLSGSPVEIFAGALRATLAALTTSGLRVLVVAPTPWLPYSAVDCLALRSAEGCTVPRADLDRKRAEVLSAMNSVVGEFKNARIWDPIDGLCTRDSCGATRDGFVVYSDAGHLSATASRSLTSRGRPVFKWLLTGRNR
jgi:peptidoglycan/LPS O-acetylase OafA/YrhL